MNSHARGTSGAELRFAWRGVEPGGARRHGTLVAPSAAAARALLRREQIVVLDLVERGTARRPKASAREVIAFTRQLASLLRAGLALAPALEVIGQSPTESGLPRIALALARRIATGMPFAKALAEHRAQFDTLYCALVAVGEASGSLAAVLERLAGDRERAAAQGAKVRAALTYPVAVLALALAIAAALLGWVVPTFAQVFDSFGASLPAPTRVVIALSDIVLRYSGPALVALGAALLPVTATVRRLPAARATFDRLSLALPIAGPMLATLAAARWSRALGTLLRAGMPLADALQAFSHATGNHVFDAASAEIAARLRRGERLAAAMRALGRFPAALVQPVAVAEESGALDTVLLDVAALAERELDEKVGMLASVCEPLIVIVLGALVGGLVVALYLPIIELGNVV